MNGHISLGGPSKREVKRMIFNAKIRLKENCSQVQHRRDTINQALTQLLNQVQKIINYI